MELRGHESPACQVTRVKSLGLKPKKLLLRIESLSESCLSDSISLHYFPILSRQSHARNPSSQNPHRKVHAQRPIQRNTTDFRQTVEAFALNLLLHGVRLVIHWRGVWPPLCPSMGDPHGPHHLPPVGDPCGMLRPTYQLHQPVDAPASFWPLLVVPSQFAFSITRERIRSHSAPPLGRRQDYRSSNDARVTCETGELRREHGRLGAS